MTSPELNPFIKTQLTQQGLDATLPIPGLGWMPVIGQPLPTPGAIPDLSMFQMSDDFGQEGFKSSALNFQPGGFPQENIAKRASFDDSLLKFGSQKGSEGPIPVNLAKYAQAAADYQANSETGTGGTVGAKKVAVLDGGLHGETVASIIGNRIGSENVIKINDPLPRAKFTKLNDFLQDGLTFALEDKTKDLNGIVAHHSGEVGTVNISSSFSKAALLSTTIDLMSENDDVYQSVLKDLGLNEDSSSDDVITALVVRIENVSDGNAKVEEAQQKFQEAVDAAVEKDMAIVVSSGNEHGIYKSIDEAFKAKFGDDFHLIDAVPDITTNVYSKGKGVITVGGIDDQGTSDISDDTALECSSRSDLVTIAANGKDVLVSPREHSAEHGDASENSVTEGEAFTGITGTSFSAPLVSAGLATIQNETGLNNVEQRTQAIVEGAVDNGEIGNRVQGAGQFNLENALEKAKEIQGGTIGDGTTEHEPTGH